MDEREATLRSAAEHVARLRQRLADGKAEIERQQAAVDENREHMNGMGKWIAEQGGVRRPLPSDD